MRRKDGSSHHRDKRNNKLKTCLGDEHNALYLFIRIVNHSFIIKKRKGKKDQNECRVIFVKQNQTNFEPPPVLLIAAILI